MVREGSKRLCAWLGKAQRLCAWLGKAQKALCMAREGSKGSVHG